MFTCVAQNNLLIHVKPFKQLMLKIFCLYFLVFCNIPNNKLPKTYNYYVTSTTVFMVSNIISSKNIFLKLRNTFNQDSCLISINPWF